jgi:hypothetical protein
MIPPVEGQQAAQVQMELQKDFFMIPMGVQVA